mmetsp:Transcript_37056/g.56826  ORF Transcript_37056/g.56826 Transcript_37056/m.56826 type:complete len:383 (-) Transcript_37056:2364-3512(-)
MPILLVLVHVDGLLRLVGLDELIFSLLVTLFVFQVESVLEVDLGKLVLGVVVGKAESFIESELVGLEVDGSFNESILDEELSTSLTIHVLSDLNGDLTKLLGVTVGLGNAESILPHLVSSVHVDSDRPGGSLNVVVLGLLEVTLTLKLLSQMLVGILQKVLAELGDQADHVIVLLGLSVDVDSKIGLIGLKVHPLGVLVVALAFELASLLHVEHRVLLLGKIARDNLIGLVPLVGADVHLEGLHKFSSLDIVLLSEIKLSHLRVVLRDLLVVGARDFRGLVGNKLDGPVPLSSVQGSLDSLVEATSLHVVLDREVQLLLANKPVSPLFFEVNNVGGEGSSGEVNGLSESVASDEGLHGSVENVHLLEEITGSLVHARSGQLS